MRPPHACGLRPSPPLHVGRVPRIPARELLRPRDARAHAHDRIDPSPSPHQHAQRQSGQARPRRVLRGRKRAAAPPRSRHLVSATAEVLRLRGVHGMLHANRGHRRHGGAVATGVAATVCDVRLRTERGNRAAKGCARPPICTVPTIRTATTFAAASAATLASERHRADDDRADRRAGKDQGVSKGGRGARAQQRAPPARPDRPGRPSRPSRPGKPAAARDASRKECECEQRAAVGRPARSRCRVNPLCVSQLCGRLCGRPYRRCVCVCVCR